MNRMEEITFDIDPHSKEKTSITALYCYESLLEFTEGEQLANQVFSEGEKNLPVIEY